MNTSAPIPWERYQTGGEIFETLWSTYGSDVAYDAAAAALDEDGPALTRILANARTKAGATRGEQANTSTLGNFAHQILTDPLAAPLDGANKILGNSFLALLKNPWVLLTLAGLVFYLVGGFDWLKRKVSRA